MLIDELLSKSDKLNIVNENISSQTKFKPICKQSVVYIVGVILINEQNQICLIEEAKSSCRHKWYLPAGRVEKNESLRDAAIRECREETGYQVEPLCVFSVEIDQAALWYRFMFMARIVGGSLKTQPDAESLQAKWFDLNLLSDGEFLKTIRSHDIVRLVVQAYEFYNAHKLNSITKLAVSDRLILPAERNSYEHLYFSFAILNPEKTHLIVCEKTAGSLAIPSFLIVPDVYLRHASSHYHMFEFVINDLLLPECFKTPDKISTNKNNKKIISIEYNPKMSPTPKDGLNIVFLIQIDYRRSNSGADLASSSSNDSSRTNKQTKSPYRWQALAGENDDNFSIDFAKSRFWFANLNLNE